MTNQERFIQIFNEKITREGADKLLDYLKKSDFFTAPASTRYHGACEGGLVAHSLNVYDCLVDILNRPRVKDLYGIEYSEESIAIAGLLHDICKVDFYKTSFRNVKDETGRWTSVPYYTIEDTLPYGHGEKSVYIISGFMRLTRDEAFAIRYHMGFSGTEDTNNVGRALEMFPLAYAVCCADMEAAFLMEGKLEGKLGGTP
ncbi:MAG: HD domain-containing protein [Clostridia bacterium]|nr:HD domain-containing protein [Clostridia bacterium]MBR2926205.1 HD domain-containing protein [Clostridia bacterium]